MKLNEEAIKVAISQLGVRETTGNNDGVQVEKYLRSIGLGKGYSWCMAFIYWCVSEAAVKCGVKYNPLVKTGGVLKQWQTTVCKRTKTPTANSIFIMDYGKGLGHTGFVERVEGDIIHTIEGNTNNDGSREGIGVFRRSRKVGTITGYILIEP